MVQSSGSLPISTGSAFSSPPVLNSLQQTVNELGSAIRRILDYDTPLVGFYENPKTFKSMGTENKFVVLDTSPGGLFISGTTYTTQITGSSGVGIKADSGNVEIESASGVSFVENGTEVIVIDTNRNTKFSHSGGSADVPDVEFDGFVRFDSNISLSGSVDFTGVLNQSISKSTAGKLSLSSSAGDITFVDSNVEASTWSDKQYGIPLSSNSSDWSTLSSLGYTSILGALTGGGVNDKVSGSIGVAGVTAGNPTGITFDLSSVPASKRSKCIDVLVNGQMLFSGSSAEVSAGSADYRLDLSGGAASADTIFGFNLLQNDIVIVIIR
tara:strand:+ start:2239 stop:3216 length:978 start_codon:yes stop_codon:yes gene_type:complete